MKSKKNQRRESIQAYEEKPQAPPGRADQWKYLFTKGPWEGVYLCPEVYKNTKPIVLNTENCLTPVSGCVTEPTHVSHLHVETKTSSVSSA